MIAENTIEHIIALCSKPVALGGWLGQPYEESGCIKFAIKFYREMGIHTDDRAMREARHFTEVSIAQFGDIAVFHYPMSWHVGVMLNSRRMIQSAAQTNGVGITPVDIYPWIESLKGFWRHKNLCS